MHAKQSQKRTSAGQAKPSQIMCTPRVIASVRAINNLHRLFSRGRLANTGHLSILLVDQGIEQSAGASFAPNPAYFEPENIVKLAIEGGCNAVASTFGVPENVARALSP